MPAFPASRSSRSIGRRALTRVAAIALIGALVGSGCGLLNKDDESSSQPKGLTDGVCVVRRGTDKAARIEPTDCSGAHDAKIIGVIGPRQVLTECPAGTDDRVVQWDENPSLRQEMTYCLDEPRPTTRQNLAVTADVSAVREFDDPAKDLQDKGDLTDYLLPGLRGEGVTCVRNELVVDEVLKAGGARTVAELAVLCLDGESIGKLLAMYAHGITDTAGARTDYDRAARCLGPAIAALDEAAQRNALQAVFDVRLDLQAPVGSPQVATQQIEQLTAC